MHNRTRTTRAAALSGLLTAVVALSGCGDATEDTTGTATAPVAVTYDGGIYLLDPASLTVTGDVGLPGFNRIDPAGDDRHLMVATETGFRVLDATTAQFTGLEFPGPEPGHVVRNAGRTVLFSDGTGQVISFDPTGLAEGKPEIREYRAAAPHHGLAVELSDGSLAVTLGEDSHDHDHGADGHDHAHDEHWGGLVVLDADRKEIARSEACPGVHGEATAQGEAVLVGCRDGALIYRDGAITKVTSPTPYGRIGNHAGSDVSPIVLGDYKKDENAELERPKQVSLIDTTDATLRLVDLGTSYSYRGLARGPQGEALVLGTDGKIHVIDPVAGRVDRTIAVIAPWEEPLDWKKPSPGLFVRDGIAYVADAPSRKVHRVDLATGEVTSSAELPSAPNEISGIVS